MSREHDSERKFETVFRYLKDGYKEEHVKLFPVAAEDI